MECLEYHFLYWLAVFDRMGLFKTVPLQICFLAEYNEKSDLLLLQLSQFILYIMTFNPFILAFVSPHLTISYYN